MLISLRADTGINIRKSTVDKPSCMQKLLYISICFNTNNFISPNLILPTKAVFSFFVYDVQQLEPSFKIQIQPLKFGCRFLYTAFVDTTSTETSFIADFVYYCKKR